MPNNGIASVSKTQFLLSFYQKVGKKFGGLKLNTYFCNRNVINTKKNMNCIQNNFWWWRSRD